MRTLDFLMQHQSYKYTSNELGKLVGKDHKQLAICVSEEQLDNFVDIGLLECERKTSKSENGLGPMTSMEYGKYYWFSGRTDIANALDRLDLEVSLQTNLKLAKEEGYKFKCKNCKVLLKEGERCDCKNQELELL